jgi:hypothetical protein
MAHPNNDNDLLHPLPEPFLLGDWTATTAATLDNNTSPLVRQSVRIRNLTQYDRFLSRTMMSGVLSENAQKRITRAYVENVKALERAYKSA